MEDLLHFCANSFLVFFWTVILTTTPFLFQRAREKDREDTLDWGEGEIPE
jgi:hypothetical protein